MKRLILAVSLVAIAPTLHPDVSSAQQPYSLVEGWGELPTGLTWGEVPGVAIDAAERVYAFHRNQPPVIEFDPSGRVAKTWGTGLFVWPHGIRVDRHGFLWITDGRGSGGKGQQVFKYTRDGQRIMTLGTAGVGDATETTFNGPTDVAVAPNGDIFVADGHVNSRIVKFTKDGRFIKAWGRKGTGPGEFDVPHTMYFDSQGRLLVGDRANKRIQIFDQEGNFIDQWLQFGSPSGIYITPDDTLYVVDDHDKKRLFVGSAKDGSMKYAINDVTLAEAVAVDRRGNIFVGETGRGKTDSGMVTGSMIRKLAKN